MTKKEKKISSIKEISISSHEALDSLETNCEEFPNLEVIHLNLYDHVDHEKLLNFPKLKKITLGDGTIFTRWFIDDERDYMWDIGKLQNLEEISMLHTCSFEYDKLKKLKKCEHLKINFSYPEHDVPFLKNIETSCIYLESYYQDYDHGLLSPLSELNQSTKEVHLGGFKFKCDANLNFFKNLKNIETINFNYCEFDTGSKSVELDFSLLNNLQSLREIIFNDSSVSYYDEEADEYFDDFAAISGAANKLYFKFNSSLVGFPSLTRLTIDNAEIKSLELFEQLEKLDNLNIRGSLFLDLKSVKPNTKLTKSLTCFSMSASKIDSLEGIEKLKSLVLLHSTDCHLVTNFNPISKLYNLTHLTLLDCQNFETFNFLKNLKKIINIKIKSKNNLFHSVLNLNLDCFINSKLSYLDLDFEDEMIDLSSLIKLPLLTNLTLSNFHIIRSFASLEYCWGITNLTLKNINSPLDLKYLKELPNLSKIEITDCSNVLNKDIFKKNKKIEVKFNFEDKKKKVEKIKKIGHLENTDGILVITDNENILKNLINKFQKTDYFVVDQLLKRPGSILGHYNKSNYLLKIYVHLQYGDNDINEIKKIDPNFKLISDKKVFDLPLKSNKIVINDSEKSVLKEDDDNYLNTFNLITSENSCPVYEVEIQYQELGKQISKKYGYLLKPDDDVDFFEVIDNKKPKSRKFPKPRKRKLGFPLPNKRMGDLYYEVYGEDDEMVQYYHQENIDKKKVTIIPFYMSEEWDSQKQKNYDTPLDLTPLTQFENLESLELKQMTRIKSFLPLAQLKKLKKLAIEYDWGWDENQNNFYPEYDFYDLPILPQLRNFAYGLEINHQYELQSIVKKMPNLEEIDLTILSGEPVLDYNFYDPDIEDLREEFLDDYDQDQVELSNLLDLRHLKKISLLFTNGISNACFTNFKGASFFEKLSILKNPLKELIIYERNWHSEIPVNDEVYAYGRRIALNNFFGLAKVSSLERLHLFLLENFPSGRKQHLYSEFGPDFLNALSNLPNLKIFFSNWTKWFEKKQWKSLDEKNKMIKLRNQTIEKFTHLEEIDNFPEIKDNSIFKKMTSLKKINGDVIITNCANLKETCGYLQNIDIGNLHLTIQDKTAVDFEELSKLISIRNKSGLYQLTVIFPFKQLKSLRGIEKLRRLSHLNVWGLGDDIDLEPLCNLTKLDEVTLTGSLYKNRRKILNRHNTGMLTVLKNYSTYDYKTKKYKTTNAIKIKDYSKDEYRFKSMVEIQQEEKKIQQKEEKTSWEFLGECYLPDGGPLGIIDPKHLPLKAKLFTDYYESPDDVKDGVHVYDSIEHYFWKHGADDIGFQDNLIYAKTDELSRIKELRIFEGGSMYIGGQSDTPVIYGKSHIYLDYYAVEGAFYNSASDKDSLRENRFKLITKKITSFKIQTNRMIIFDHENWAKHKGFAEVLKKKPIDNKITFIEDNNKFQSGNISNVVRIESYHPNYLINCENGTYDVFSIQSDLQRKKLKAKDVQIKFTCCSQTKTFHKDLIVQKKYGPKKGNPVDYFYCDKCDKLIGGFNEEIRDMMFDAKGEKINFDKYSLEGYNYQPYKDNFFCYAIRLRENNNQDMKLGFESPLLK